MNGKVLVGLCALAACQHPAPRSPVWPFGRTSAVHPVRVVRDSVEVAGRKYGCEFWVLSDSTTAMPPAAPAAQEICTVLYTAWTRTHQPIVGPPR